jgi:glutamyl-Q tRNA(Asp) synthetase
LICALASYLDARSHGGLWLLRMEDIDPPREQPGAARAILSSLHSHGLHWDGPVLWQSERLPAYTRVVDSLLEQGLAFRCDCSRRQLASEGGVYRGRCRERQLSADIPSAVRLRVEGDCLIRVQDCLQQPLEQALDREVGDFIIRRKDSLFAYQLAVVLDDAEQGVTHVLRGSDLYDSTPRQIYLQRTLGLHQPTYTHIPVITNSQGHKLSKQTHAPALDSAQAARHLRMALKFLCQQPPPVSCNTVPEILEHALEHWHCKLIPATLGVPESCLA